MTKIIMEVPTMRISFNENPILPRSDVDHDIKFSTNLYIGKYILKILHGYGGVGMTDKYEKVSFIEIYLGEENVTKHLAKKVGFDQFPIEATVENLMKLLE